MLCALRMLPFSQAAIEVNSGSGDPKVSKGQAEAAWECPHRRGRGGDRRLRLFSLPPRRLRRGDSLCLRERPAMVGSQAAWSRPFGATQHSCWIERLGGRVCGRAKLGAGTLRCLHLGGLFPLSRFDEEQLGRCPKPQQGRRPCTLQGALPLDPFWLPGLVAFPYNKCPGSFCAVGAFNFYLILLAFLSE